MGQSKSKEESKEQREETVRSKEMDELLKEQAQNELQMVKLLFLGAGESGKSTLFKQMVTLYGEGYSDAERRDFISTINANIIKSIKALVVHSSLIEGCEMDPKLAGSAKFVSELKMEDDIAEEEAAHIKALWADEGIKRCYECRSQFQLLDSCAYFFDKIDEIAEASYLPIDQDIFNCRARTTGIVENIFEIDNTQFLMVDVGGQRNERKKWIHCFDKVTAILFVTAMSVYDQVLFEDNETNRLLEAMDLFYRICNSAWFKLTPIILFLNKTDLFRQKIVRVPLSETLPSYAEFQWQDDQQEDLDEDEQEFRRGCAFLAEEFDRLNEEPERRAIFTHFTCATDTKNVESVFSDVKNIIVTKHLEDLGLVA
eukprot:TRINITY_DN67856_c2_g4_i1.p1 TRINITY_DN67856_c2_g4~~TRINITY_DN67856_c2_g4_i1.p1  ORF type:complete len:371 (-),score=168.10 TRINITY_DN67856_c2_g4_i1:135-1247(-)